MGSYRRMTKLLHFLHQLFRQTCWQTLHGGYLDQCETSLGCDSDLLIVRSIMVRLQLFQQARKYVRCGINGRIQDSKAGRKGM